MSYSICLTELLVPKEDNKYGEDARLYCESWEIQ